MQFFPPFDGTEDSKKYGDPNPDEIRPTEGDESSEQEHCCKHFYWRKDAAYWRLPENVRHAVDVAKMKSKHSEFWYRLQTLNDKIFIYRSVFYSKMPAFQKVFLEKKQKALEEKLKNERLKFEKEMKEMNIKMKRKLKSTNTMIIANESLQSKIEELQRENRGESGISAAQMISNMKKKSSKKLTAFDVPKGRIQPRRAMS